MRISQPVPHGKTVTVLDINSSGADSVQEEFSIESDSVLISLFADVVSGSLTVSVYTLTDTGKELPVITFPVLTAPTSQLVLKKAAAVMSRIRVVATYTGATQFEVRARAISAGETSVKIVGASTGKASQLSVGVTPTLLFPISLTDRNGLIVKNFSGSGILYLGWAVGEAVTGTGYPIGPGESLGIDVGGGATLYGAASAGTIDVRLMESAT